MMILDCYCSVPYDTRSQVWGYKLPSKPDYIVTENNSITRTIVVTRTMGHKNNSILVLSQRCNRMSRAGNTVQGKTRNESCAKMKTHQSCD
jgi:hypothetical protein